MNLYPDTSGTAPNTTYWQYCANRLPCGVCRLTSTICPLWNGSQIGITWNDATCQVKEEKT